MTTKRKALGRAAIHNVTDGKVRRTADKSERTLAKLKKILERVDRLPILDHRSDDEILGYDENGVPR